MTKVSGSIIVFGASGFIGGELVQYLKQDLGYERVYGFSSKDCNMTVIKSVQSTLSSIDGPLTIIHCSAIGRRTEDSERAYYKNVLMVENLIRSLDPKLVNNIIFMSSVDIYGCPSYELPITEMTRIKPYGYYGKSKQACEGILKDYASHQDIPLSVLRLPGVYGANDRGSSIIGRFLLASMNDEPIYLTGDGMHRRDYLYIQDLCELVGNLIEEPQEDLLVNIAPGNSVRMNELVEIVRDITSKEVDVIYEPKSDRDADLIFDNDVFRGWRSQFKFKEIEKGIQEYWDMLQLNHASMDRVS